MNRELKRSNAPILWLLFGAGGMLSALTRSALVFITAIAVPLGPLLPPDLLSYPHCLAVAQSFLGKAFLLVIVALFFWHAGHRIVHTAHDLGLHAGTGAKLVCYGLPLLSTLVTAYALLSLGF